VLRPQLWRKLKHVSELMDALLRIVQDLTLTLALIITASCTNQPPIRNIKLFQIDVADKQTDDGYTNIYKSVVYRQTDRQTDRQTTGIQIHTKSVECINLQYRQTDRQTTEYTDDVKIRTNCTADVRCRHCRCCVLDEVLVLVEVLVVAHVFVVADDDKVFISCTNVEYRCIHTDRQTDRWTSVYTNIYKSVKCINADRQTDRRLSSSKLRTD